LGALTAEASPFQVDPDDAQNAHEYASEIYALLFRDEAAILPRANYMDSQTDINGKMRAILIDWLIEVHMKYRLRSETLFLTVNLIDRYLSRTRVMRKKLQLVGVVAMFIASKFEEINPPEIKDFVHITDNAYTKEDVLVMECTMLTTLNFQIVVPTAAQFLDRLQKVNRCDDQHRELAAYLIDLSLLEMRMLRYSPSHIVSAALLLSNVLLGKRQAWAQSMVQHSHYSEQALVACTEELREFFEAAPKSQLQAVRKKFSQPQRHNVARMTFP
jgi:cyclin B